MTTQRMRAGLFMVVLALMPLAPAQEKAPRVASIGGKYSQLIRTIECPDDKGEYGELCDEGRWDATTYAGVSVPEGYWVYVYPKWYIWAKRDLGKIGFEVIKRKVQLKEILLEVHFEHHRKNRKWAGDLLEVFIKALPELEKRSGKSFPGVNPYVIYEDPNRKSLGSCGASGMALASPPAAGNWVLLHEAVHIWNAGGHPHWVCEGLADYISYHLMLQFKVPFKKGGGMPPWIRRWRKLRGTARDCPLNDPKDRYYEVSRAKTVEFWQILYEHYGHEFIDKCFRRNIEDRDLTNNEFAEMLKTAGAKDPSRFMSGWLIKGEYRIRTSECCGRDK